MSRDDKPCSSSEAYMAGKVEEILRSSDHSKVAELVTKLCYGKEIDDSSKLLYDCFKRQFPNVLAVNLLRVYRFTSPRSPKIRSYSLSLLDSLLLDLEDSRIFLETEVLKDMKAHLNACLLQQETSDHDFKLLSTIISRVAVDIFIDNISWDELCSYIVSLQHDNKKMLLIFGELPTVLDEDFVMPLLENNLDVNILKGLADPECDEEWCLASEAAFNLMLQLINLDGNDMVWDMLYAIVNSAWKMVNVSKREIVVRKGLIRLARMVRREGIRFRDSEYEVVSRLASMLKRINGIGKETEMAAETIREVLESNCMEGKALDWGFIQSQIGFYSSATL